MSEITISPEVITKWHKNTKSGHEWSTLHQTKRLLVSGGLFFTTTHLTMKSAEKEKEIQESINRKFPFIMPRSKREIERRKQLNLPISYPYKEMETGNIILDIP